MTPSGRGAHIVCATALLLAALLAAPLAAQRELNIYRYVLDVDAPEPAGLVALDATTSRVLRGSMPKPLAATLVHLRDANGDGTAAALEAAPYYVLGGGVRSYAAHRSMSVAGRLMRVLTKTTISVAAVPGMDASGTRIGVGIRSTLHDPHDPTTALRLPEQVDSVLAAAAGAAGPAPERAPPLADDDLRGSGPEVRRLMAQARRDARARAGDAQVAAGWGMARVVDGADRDDWGAHTFWVTAQHTRGPRTDLLATLQLLDAFGSTDWRVGVGVQTKSAVADLRTELFYDGAHGGLHPGAAVEAHVVPGMGAVVSLGREPRTDAVRVAALVRWYFVSRH